MTTLEQEITCVFNNAGQPIDDKILAEYKSICQVFNLEPSGLFWKLEALNYSQHATRSGISQITMDTLSAVKTQIQQELARENKNNKRVPSTLNTAQVNRLKLPAYVTRNLAQGSGSTAVQTKQEQLGDGISTSNNISTTATVVFHGPKLDQESKKKRAYRYMYEKNLREE